MYGNNDYRDYLEHHGILGQKWGVRRFQNEDGSLTDAGRKRYSEVVSIKSEKNGDTIYLNRLKNRNPNSKDANFVGYVNGKKIADLMLEDYGDTLYTNWISVKSSERGKGYASALMNYAIKYGTENGYKNMTLEVPGLSPDAKHIYEKYGFKEEGKTIDSDYWEGLTSMKRKL